MNSIILRIANQEETSAGYIEVVITPEIKAKFNIPENARAVTEGLRSAVYENSLGQIVAFTETNACPPAYKSIGRNSEILPEIYDLEEIDLEFHGDKYKFCVIVMEKLQPLDDSEYPIALNYMNKFNHDDEFPSPDDKLGTEFIDLFQAMKDNNIYHFDLHPGNIAWSKDGSLKLIDWESIDVPTNWV